MRLWLKDSERRPDPAPAVTDDRKPLITGLVLWLLALGVLLVAFGPAGPSGDYTWIVACLIGAVMGGVGLAFVYRQRRTATRR
jgi:peptidoglycan/LPS O-acetylase OafA/YrhL